MAQPRTSSPSPEGKGRAAQRYVQSVPQPALWAYTLGKGLATWSLLSRYFVAPTPTPPPQPSISPSHYGPGLGRPRHSPPPPWYTGFCWGHQAPLCPLLSVVHGVRCPQGSRTGQAPPCVHPTPVVNVPLNKVGETGPGRVWTGCACRVCVPSGRVGVRDCSRLLWAQGHQCGQLSLKYP